MSQPFLLGTRGSELALAQATMTRAALAAAGIACEVRIIQTIGDKRPDLKLSEFSQGENAVVDKGIFTKELEEALLRREIDFAVHSLKDVPTELAPEFEICCTLPRAETPDILLTTEEGLGADLTLLHGRTIATSSVRRARQLSWLCQGVEVVDIRGNVPTRIRKLIEHAARGEWHGILLARAGLERLGIYTPGENTFDFEGTLVHARELARAHRRARGSRRDQSRPHLHPRHRRARLPRRLESRLPDSRRGQDLVRGRRRHPRHGRARLRRGRSLRRTLRRRSARTRARSRRPRRPAHGTQILPYILT